MNSSFGTNILTCTKLKDLAAFVTSFLHNIINILPAILLKTFPTPIGFIPGFLSNGIKLLTVKTLRECVDCSSSEESFLMEFSKIYEGHLMNFQIN